DQTNNTQIIVPATVSGQVVTYAIQDPTSGNTNLYYQRDKKNAISPTSPIQAYCTFTSPVINTPTITLLDSFNISNVALAITGGPTSMVSTYTFTMINSLKLTGSLSYGVSIQQGAAANTLFGYSITDKKHFVVFTNPKTTLYSGLL